MNLSWSESFNRERLPTASMGSGHSELPTAHRFGMLQHRFNSHNNQTTNSAFASAAFGTNDFGRLTNGYETEHMYSQLLPQVNMNARAPAPLFRHHHELSRESMPQQMSNAMSAPDSSFKEIIRFIDAIDDLAVSRFGVSYNVLLCIKDEMEAVEKALEAEKDAISSTLLSRLRVPRGLGAASNGIFPTGSLPAAIEHHFSSPNLPRNESNGESKTEEENKDSNPKYDSSPSESGHESEEDDTPLCLPNGTNDEVNKRPRRQCRVNKCTNRVVQGGLCISHGATRRTCNVPGCTKHVKAQGKCSAHGPERKKCEAEGCTKAAIQGGKCVGHGAKKKLCRVEGCIKQSAIGGMCKKHYDKHNGVVKVR